MENFGKRPIVTTLGSNPWCDKSVPNLAETQVEDFRIFDFACGLHSFHIEFTAGLKEDCDDPCKTQKITAIIRLIAQSIC